LNLHGRSVVMIGDSHAQGLDPHVGNRILDLGAKSYRAITLSGKSTGYIVEHGGLAALVAETRADIAILVTGTNDGIALSDRMREQADIERLVMQARPASPLFWGPPTMRRSDLVTLASVIAQTAGPIAEGHGGSYVDSRPITQYAEPSGAFHFTRKGYEWWAEAALGASFPDNMGMARLPASFDPTKGTGVWIRTEVLHAGEEIRIPLGYLSALAKKESGGNPRNQNPSGATGLFQIMPRSLRGAPADRGRGGYNGRWNESLAVTDLFDPEVSIRVASRMMGEVIATWSRDYPEFLSADWYSPRFVGLFAMGWNMGPGISEVVRVLRDHQYKVPEVSVETVWHAASPALRHAGQHPRDPDGRSRLNFARAVASEYAGGRSGGEIIEILAARGRGRRGEAPRFAQAGMGGGGGLLLLAAAGTAGLVLAAQKKRKKEE
jgi:hypothetical protein